MERVRSPSKKRPFGFNPKHAAKMSRLHRLQQKGLTPATDKASMREACNQAVAERPDLLRTARANGTAAKLPETARANGDLAKAVRANGTITGTST
jgi:hypothetical protein